MSKAVVLRPRVSEKAFATSKEQNAYVFMVPVELNKQTVANAIVAQFDVTVEAVNILNVKGKTKRTVRKDGRVFKGRQADSRKAYVKLKDGDHLPIFAAEEEAEQKAEKDAEKAAKKAKKTEAPKTDKKSEDNEEPAKSKRRFGRTK